ncbi:glycosyltransferase [Halegenticoccus tardaugens]|uniref:glycosyltransferase n=1 Tax=Halegenticoccus tardaugens TaxID=2071624 RepID=UPI00100AF58F|nr:glycosyltransferase [Halegenticoccus tardaugens]
MHVLNLTTNAEARFYKLQVRALESRGVTCTTLSVPGSHLDGATRSPSDYLRFFPKVLGRAGGPYDIVHANYGLTAPMALAQPTRPIVLTLWGSDLHGRYGTLSKACARFFDDVIVMSEKMRDELDRECTVIPHGVDLELFRPIPREEARAEVGWDDDAYHVLFPYDTERPVKDYPRAERVVDAVDRKLEEQVELHTISGLPHARMPVYLNASDSLLLTSKSEGSPNVVKEALACDVPIVSTDVGDVRERLAGVDGTAVCRSDDELISNLATILRRNGRSDGRDVARELSVDGMADRICAVYERALARN